MLAGVGRAAPRLAPPAAVDAPVTAPALSDQQQAAIAWGNQVAAGQPIHATLFDQNGSVTAPDVLVSTTTLATIPANAPSAVWGGASASNFLVAWEEGGGARSIHAATVSTAGSIS